MRYFKLFLVAIFSVISFNACKKGTDVLPEENVVSKQETIALQSMFKGVTNESYSSTTHTYVVDSLCFQFVYPIQLSYNTQNNLTINNFNGLIEAINNQSSQLYITGIVTPFQITIQGQVQTINTEAEMVALIESCDYFTLNQTIENSFCFDIVFPIQVISETGQTVTINSTQDFESFLKTQGIVYQADVVFPLQVLFDDGVITVTNMYDFIELIYSCDDDDDNDCVCNSVYSPVCVQTPNGVIEYGNMCFAECAGYDQSDVVPCNNGGNCSIFNFNIGVGDCNADDTFNLKIDFNYNNPESDEFEVYALDSISGMPGTWNLIGTYALDQLPLTITEFPDSETYFQWFKVEIKNNPNCSVSGYFISPNCSDDTCNCTTVYAPVCVNGPSANIITFDNACLAECAGYSSNDFVACESDDFDFATGLGTCFSIQYPVQVQSNGYPVTINSNADLLLYHFPNLTPIPAFVYPIQVNFEEDDISITIQINNQEEFITNLNAYCD